MIPQSAKTTARLHRPPGASHRLRDKRLCRSPSFEWMQCTIADVQTAITELRTGQHLTGARGEAFSMRPEQAAAVKSRRMPTSTPIWKEACVRCRGFLWNAKMRFGKTFATYQLAKKLGTKKVLVVTFKPAVEDAWRHDLLRVTCRLRRVAVTLPKTTGTDPTHGRQEQTSSSTSALFQDLLGKDKSGNIKPKNTVGSRGLTGILSCSTSTTSAHGGIMPRNSSRARTRQY